jgi:hypothetical protein
MLMAWQLLLRTKGEASLFGGRLWTVDLFSVVPACRELQ